MKTKHHQDLLTYQGDEKDKESEAPLGPKVDTQEWNWSKLNKA